MADLSPPTSIFAFVTTWSTPASLFVFLNVMIAALALASRFGTHNKPAQEDPHLVPAPSLLQRVKSIDYFYRLIDNKESYGNCFRTVLRF
ncbi:hypothetical protein OIU84_010632 [Salix udensis]|uniref:DUF4408 domain-containing protein n=1 Tax=Salix udensis TaxID=889485 RepID=A0AAD6JN53_9ROSI|nr:hypothetical protein OIU84_010632 [Salix udensis]